MRLLIDGYNLMHAAGRVPRASGPGEFRKSRERFLDELAARLGDSESRETVVVFDAALKYRGPNMRVKHRELTVIYAAGEESADSLIMDMAIKHPAPKLLTIVTSDVLVRQAPARRGCQVLSSEEFLDKLSVSRPVPAKAESKPIETARGGEFDENEAEHWQRVFAEVDRMSELKEAFSREEYLPTDAELARVREEVEAEGATPPRAKRPKPPRR